MKNISTKKQAQKVELGKKPMSVWLRRDIKLVHTHQHPLQKLAFAVIASALDSIVRHKDKKYVGQAANSYLWLHGEHCQIMCDSLSINHTNLISFVDDYIATNNLHVLVNKLV